MFETHRISAGSIHGWNPDRVLYNALHEFIGTRKVDVALDYGAGNSPYRSLIECTRYIKADITQNLAGDIDYVLNTDPTLPLPDNSIDLILLIDVLEHIEKPSTMLREFRRLLKPEGTLIISIPFIYREHETPLDFTRYTVFGAKSLIANHGGRILRCKKVGNIFYTILTLFLERGIVNGEHSRLSLGGRILNRILCVIAFFFMSWLSHNPESDSGIYHHLFLEVDFS